MVGKNQKIRQSAYLEAEEIQKFMLWWMPWAIRGYIDSQEASYTIPPKSDAANPWPVDWYTYKERPLVECSFQKLKWFRRVFTRYDKLDTSFLAFVYIAAIAILLK